MGSKEVLLNIVEKIKVFSWHKNAVRIQKDKRRVAIANSVKLTKEQKEQIDNFFKTNYGRKINYRWHKLYTAISGKFDYRYFPEFLYSPDFQRLSNDPNYRVGYQDKNILPLIIKGSNVGVNVPETYFSCSNGIIMDKNCKVISEEEMLDKLTSFESFFIKPSIDSNSGENCWKYTKEQFDKKVFIENTLKVIGKNYVIQECLKNQFDIKALNNSSLNTFRVITYIVDGKINCSPIILRIGRNKSHRDNAHAGGLFVAVNNNGEIISNGKTEFGEDIEIHPDSNIKLKGYKIQNVYKIIDAAKKVASLVPRIGVIDWDFILNEKGEPVCIEGNMFWGGIWLIQMSHGESAFGDNTARVLQLIKNNKPLYK